MPPADSTGAGEAACAGAMALDATAAARMTGENVAMRGKRVMRGDIAKRASCGKPAAGGNDVVR
jgi:hypothetical protein